MAVSRSVARSVVLPVAIPEAWQALADPGRLARWLGVELSLDVRTGGSGVASGPAEARGMRIDALEAHRRLVWTWWPLGDGAPPSRVELVLVPEGEGARLTVTETVLADLDGSGEALPDSLAGARR